MNIKKKCLILLISSALIIFFIFSNSYAGDIYYVSLQGNDITGDGSENKPWATINKAINWLKVNGAEGGWTLKVKPGEYKGDMINIRGSYKNEVIIESEIPYQARLRIDYTVMQIYYASNITIRGFDIAETAVGGGYVLLHIDSSEDFETHHVTLENNIIHDSTRNDLVKIGGTWPHHITIRGNIFYNNGEIHQCIDTKGSKDGIIEDNIFFADYQGSGREVVTGLGFIVFKGGTSGYVVRRNIFLSCPNWDSGVIHIGENGKRGAHDILLENNLFIGNDLHSVKAVFLFYASEDIHIRNNTIVGDFICGNAYGAFFWGSSDTLEPPARINFSNNIWADYTGTMGKTEWYEAFMGEMQGWDSNGQLYYILNADFTLNNNLYWNATNPIPGYSRYEYDNLNQRKQVFDDITKIDKRAIVSDPYIYSDQNNIVLPKFNYSTNQFLSGSKTVKEEFERLVDSYCAIGPNSASIDKADPNDVPQDDILGRERVGAGSGVDIGAYEYGASKIELKILTTKLPDGKQASYYEQVISIIGGTKPYTIEVLGDIPPGLSLNKTNYLFFGMPEKAGKYNFNIAVSDSSKPSNKVSQNLSITILENKPPANPKNLRVESVLENDL